jgi:cbb3-type cytochrome oxidase maturation protein
MGVILVLLIASLALALCFLAAFLWSVGNGQFDDPVTPAMRILTDDDPSPRKPALPKNSEQETNV